jgi:multicomponent Na+:H+ antiporter subunit G
MLLQIVGLIILWIGVGFCTLGVVGLIRLPDVYCRLHASGKVATLGICGLLIGSSLLLPAISLKALALAIFVAISSPVASHAIALAAYRQGVAMINPVRDDLAARQPQDSPAVSDTVLAD